MPGTPRVRARSAGSFEPGTSVWTTFSGSVTNYAQDSSIWPAAKIEQCDDVVGNRDSDNGLAIEKTNRDVYPINGAVISPGLFVKQYNNWMPPAVTEAIAHQALSPPSLNAAVTALMARTNPGRTHMSLPVAVGELKDLPGLVRQGIHLYRRYLRSRRTPRDYRNLRAGLQAANDGSGIYLAYQFGVAPMISDVRKLLDFQAVQKRRADELQRLYSGKGLKRRITIYQETVQNQQSVTLSSHMNVIVGGQKTTTTTGKMWGTIRWKPTSPPPTFRQGDSMALLARRVAYGANSVNFVDAWNLMPWSWLIDWFSDTGDWLEANTHRIPAAPSDICIMYQRDTKAMTTKLSHPTLTMQSSTVTRTTKERNPRTGHTLPEANFGAVLTSRQQSILGALAVTRHLRHV